MLRGIILLFTIFSISTSVAQTEFITTWKTDNPGPSIDTSIRIPIDGTGYNFEVDWSYDGLTFNVEDTFTDAQLGIGYAGHNYGAGNEGTYTVAIRGTFPRIYFNNSGSKEKILTIEQWGNIAWDSFYSAFMGCSNLNITNLSIDNPDLSNVTDMSRALMRCNAFNGDITGWDVSSVTNLYQIFWRSPFNQDIGSWDVSSVQIMANMFMDSQFNQDIGSWELNSIFSLDNMFFDGSLSTTNYDNLLTGWANNDNLNPNANASNMGATYCNGNFARYYLINFFNWNLSDDGEDCSTLGIDETENNNQFSFYPNPSNGLIHFKGIQEETKIEIFSISGKKLFEKIVFDNSEIKIDLNSGIYLARLTSSYKTSSKKLIIN